MGHTHIDTTAIYTKVSAVHIGHSTGGGDVAGYIARHGQPQRRVAKAVPVRAVPPMMGKTPANPGTPIEVFDRGYPPGMLNTHAVAINLGLLVFVTP